MDGKKIRTRWSSKSYSDLTIIRVFNHLARKIPYEGLPKNQYREILTWLRFFGLIDQKNNLTELGKLIYRYDPFFEEATTKLICQYNFIKAPTLIREAFTINTNEIDKIDFINHVYRKYPESKTASLERDFGIMTACYIYQPSDPEEGNGFFSDLGLLGKYGERYYRHPAKLEYFDSWFILALLSPLHGEINMEKAYEHIKDPFNLDTSAFLHLMYRCDQVKLVTNVGLNVLYLPEKIDFIKCLEKSFKNEL